MKIAVLTCLAVMAAPLVWAEGMPTLGQPTSGQSSGLFNGITMDELEAVVKASNHTYKRLNDKYEYLEVKSPDDYTYEINLGDCPENGEKRCTSINFYSYNFNEKPNVTLKGINNWNADAWGVKGVLHKDGTSAVSMNLGADGGVTADWIAARMGNFDYWLTSYGNFVSGNTPAPASEPTPGITQPSPTPTP
jgi:hypothetical protein